MNFYRHFPGDYLRDTLHLTAAEDGMYRRLLDLAYTTEKPLPTDRVLIYRLTRCRSRSDKRAIDRVMTEFFTKTRHGYTNKRVQEELKLAKSRVKAARDNGGRGGRPKTQEKPSGLAVGLQNQTQEKALQTPDYQSPEKPSSSITSSQDQMAVAVHPFPPKSCGPNGNGAATAAFTDIGFEKPFGRPNFQAIWTTHFLQARAAGTYVTQAMEDTIQECQKANIGIPPQFYDAKHDVEIAETRARQPLEGKDDVYKKYA